MGLERGEGRGLGGEEAEGGGGKSGEGEVGVVGGVVDGLEPWLALLQEGFCFGPIVGGEFEREGEDEVLKGVGWGEDPCVGVFLGRKFDGYLNGPFVGGLCSGSPTGCVRPAPSCP